MFLGLYSKTVPASSLPRKEVPVFFSDLSRFLHVFNDTEYHGDFFFQPSAWLFLPPLKVGFI